MPARRHNHNRRHKGKKVTRRVDGMAFKFPSASQVTATWKKNLTVRQNFAAMGISLGANDNKSLQSVALHRLQDALGIKLEWVDIDDVTAAKVKEITHPEGVKHKDHMSPEELEYLERLEAKYGRNYSSMQRDSKLNFWLHSELKLAGMFEKMERYKAYLVTSGAVGGGEAAAPAPAAAVMEDDVPAAAAPVAGSEEGKKKKKKASASK